jgi:hypothetical protein
MVEPVAETEVDEGAEPGGVEVEVEGAEGEEVETAVEGAEGGEVETEVRSWVVGQRYARLFQL